MKYSALQPNTPSIAPEKVLQLFVAFCGFLVLFVAFCGDNFAELPPNRMEILKSLTHQTQQPNTKRTKTPTKHGYKMKSETRSTLKMFQTNRPAKEGFGGAVYPEEIAAGMLEIRLVL